MPVQIHNENALPFGFEPEFSGNINPTSLRASIAQIMLRDIQHALIAVL